MLRVKDNPELIRDENSKAILNINQQSLDNYKMQRKRILEDSPVLKLEKEVVGLKQEINDIKNLLLEVLKKN